VTKYHTPNTLPLENKKALRICSCFTD